MPFAQTAPTLTGVATLTLAIGGGTARVRIDAVERDTYNARMRMVRADYGGDGMAYTLDGQSIDIYGPPGVQKAGVNAAQRFEAGWSPDGAVCVRHVPAKQTTSLKKLAVACPPPEGTHRCRLHRGGHARQRRGHLQPILRQPRATGSCPAAAGATTPRVTAAASAATPAPMLPAVIPYPDIDPIAIAVGPLAIRWYALAYIAGLVVAWLMARRIVEQPPRVMSAKALDDFLFWAALGVILGGRLGYVLFYKPGFYLENPLKIFTVWEGGMSFHGGLLGVTLAIIFYARKQKADLFAFADVIGIVAPQGLFFGRMANFINGELWGRPTDVAWAMIFPRDPLLTPRHPSQLYQACLEGLILFAITLVLWRVYGMRRRPGFICGVFWAGYGLARIIGELWREPDAHLGYLAGNWLTMGMILSLPLVAFGAWLITRAMSRPPVTA